MMIKRGAHLITSVRDIFEQYPYEMSTIKRASGKPVKVEIKKPKIKQAKEKKEEEIEIIPDISVDDNRYKGLNEAEKTVIELLLKGNLHIDELARECKMDIKTLNSVLPVLELMGHISKMPGNYYKITL